MLSELRKVYQKQVDEVVSGKQQEFQTQLDSVEASFQLNFEAKQKSIAEYAARKIKNIIDKLVELLKNILKKANSFVMIFKIPFYCRHQLEINLVEEKHKEEKRLGELQRAQMVQKCAILEAQLNSQQTNKNQLAEQLHSLMQSHWEQAVRVITGEYFSLI